MNDAILVGVVERSGNRGEKIAALCRTQPSAPFEKLCQAIAFDQLHCNIGSALAGDISNLKGLNDMWMSKFGDGACFLAESLEQVRIGAGGENLECYEAILYLIVRFVDRGRAAPSQAFSQEVASDLTTGCKGI